MKTIGLIGGLSWYSTLDYYRIIDVLVNKRLGENEAAKIIMYSVNYGEIVKLTKSNNWEAITAIIADAAKKIEKGGADCLIIGANTMHKIADDVAEGLNIPLIHIADATAKAINEKGINTVALLGTKYTMQLPFYKDRLLKHQIHTLIPDEDGIQMVNTTIYEELGKGLVLTKTKQMYVALIDELAKRGAQGVILGCTENPILIKEEDCAIPVFDTTYLHAKAAVDFALA